MHSLVFSFCLIFTGLFIDAERYNLSEGQKLWKYLFSDSVTPEYFISHFWEKKPFVLNRQIKNYYKYILSLEVIDFIINTTTTVYDTCDLLADYPCQPISPNANPITSQDLKIAKRVSNNGKWITGLLPVKELSLSDIHVAVHQHHFSIILNRINFRWPALGKVCNLISESIFGYRTNANMYLTPPNTQAFEYHFDWMHSFILQISGQKNLVYLQ